MKRSSRMFLVSTALVFAAVTPGFTGMSEDDLTKAELVELDAGPDAPMQLDLQLTTPNQPKSKRFLDILEGTLEEIAGPQSWSSPLPKAASKFRMAQLLDHPDPEQLSRVDMDHAPPGSVQSFVSDYVFALDVLVGQLNRLQENTQAVENARRYALIEQSTLLQFTDFTDSDLAELHILFNLPQFTLTLELPEIRLDRDPVEG